MVSDAAPRYDDLTFLSPLSDERAGELSRFVVEFAEGTVADVGCGWAELLIRVLETGPGLHGIGIDLDAGAIEHGRGLARRRGVEERVELIAGDVKQHLPRAVGGVTCIGAGQIWGPPVEARLPLDYRSALLAIRGVLAPGMPAVFGEGIWATEPTQDAIAPLGGRRDEFVSLATLLDIARECGFAVVRTHQASLDEWDRFESGYTAGDARWLANHSSVHPDANDVGARLAAQTAAYFRGYRGVLGIPYLQLLAVEKQPGPGSPRGTRSPCLDDPRSRNERRAPGRLRRVGRRVGSAVLGTGTELITGELDQIELRHAIFRIHPLCSLTEGSGFEPCPDTYFDVPVR